MAQIAATIEALETLNPESLCEVYSVIFCCMVLNIRTLSDILSETVLNSSANKVYLGEAHLFLTLL